MTTTIYINGTDTQFKDAQHMADFITDQATTEEVAKSNYLYVKAIFENNVLSQLLLAEQGSEDKPVAIQDNCNNLPLPAVQLRTPKLIVFNEKGMHQMGGAYPGNFAEPVHNAVTPFQYIGCISRADTNFAWLPFDLHITFPIYLNCVPLFFDYSNPEKPVVINIADVNTEHSNLEPHINKNSIIEFEQARFDFIESTSFYNADGNTFGHAGLAKYAQPNHLPKSPKTGNLMPFVCQLMKGVKMKHCDVQVTEDYYKASIATLNFWGDAYLVVYCEPATKIVCCLISH
jgi:hypothetical protein